MSNRKSMLAVFAIVGILLATSYAAPVVVSEFDEDSDVDAIRPNVKIAGVIIGVVAVSILATWLLATNGDLPDGGNTEALRQEARSTEAESVTSTMTNAFSMAETLAAEDKEMVAFTTSYFARMAEIAAAEDWSEDGTMDMDAIIDASTARDTYTTLTQNYMTVISDVFDNYKSRLTEWSTTDVSETFGTMGLSFDWISGSQVATGTSDVYAEAGVATTVTSSTADRVYLFDGDDTDSGFIYVLGGSATATSATGTVHNLTAGYNRLSEAGIVSGLYELSTDRTYLGSISPSKSTDRAELCAGVAMVSGTDLSIAMKTSTNYRVATAAQTYANVSAIDYKIAYDATSSSASLLPMIDAVGMLLDASEDVYTRTITAASTAWQVYDTAGAASIFASPSAIIPNLDNVDVTDQQAYMIYMAALQQMSDYYEHASGNFDATDVVISEGSLDMTCVGTIYNDSNVAVATDVTFTPMCYLRDQAVRIGMTTWQQPGLAMIWGDSAWDGTDNTGTSFVPLDIGYSFNITKITYGDEVLQTAGDAKVLTVKTLTDIDGFEQVADPSAPEIPTLFDSTILVRIIGALIGALVLVGGVYTRNPIMILIGLVVAVAGWFVAPMIAGALI